MRLMPRCQLHKGTVHEHRLSTGCSIRVHNRNYVYSQVYEEAIPVAHRRHVVRLR